MEEFLKFLQIPAVQILGWSFGIIGWIIGIFSGYLQVKGYYEQQTDREPFQYLFEQVQRDWRGQYTEQQIAELTAQFKLLEEQIRIQIPREARRVFLEDQKATIASTIASLYEQYETTNKNLDSFSAQSKLAPAIQSAIEQHIKPSYVKQQEQQNFIYRLMFIILVLLLLPISPVALLIQLAVFPLIDFFNTTDGKIVLFFLITQVVLVMLTFLIPLSKIRNLIYKHKVFLIVATGLLLIFAILLFLSIYLSIVYIDGLWVWVYLLVSFIAFAVGSRLLIFLTIYPKDWRIPNFIFLRHAQGDGKGKQETQ